MIMHVGDVGTEIAPEVTGDPELAVHRSAALPEGSPAPSRRPWASISTATRAVRKFFNLSERYARWRDYRVAPRGSGLHGLQLEPGQVIRLTQEEVEAHPAWTGFGDQAAEHPPMRGRLAVAVCGNDGRSYGLLQLSDKSDGGDFTEQDEENISELAAFAGATLDALRATRPSPSRHSFKGTR
jgi:GAF domain-containing protein